MDDRRQGRQRHRGADAESEASAARDAVGAAGPAALLLCGPGRHPVLDGGGSDSSCRTVTSWPFLPTFAARSSWRSRWRPSPSTTRSPSGLGGHEHGPGHAGARRLRHGLIVAARLASGALRGLRMLLHPHGDAARGRRSSAPPSLFLVALAHLPLANVSAVLQALPLAVTMGAALVLRRDGRLAALAGDRRRLRRRADHRAAGLRRLQRLCAAGRWPASSSARCAISPPSAFRRTIPSLLVSVVDGGPVTICRRRPDRADGRLVADGRGDTGAARRRRPCCCWSATSSSSWRCAPATSPSSRRSATPRCCGRSCSAILHLRRHARPADDRRRADHRRLRALHALPRTGASGAARPAAESTSPAHGAGRL